MDFFTFKKIDDDIINNIKFDKEFIDNCEPMYKKYKVTVEEIKEDENVYIERLKNLYNYISIKKFQDPLLNIKKIYIKNELFNNFGIEINEKNEFIEISDTNNTVLNRIKIFNEIFRIKLFNFYYKIIEITYDKDYGYSWGLECNYKFSGRTGYVFPLKNLNYVKFWKTFDGAKNDLIKKFIEK